MRTEFLCLLNNSQVFRVRGGAAAPQVFLTRITCLLYFKFLSGLYHFYENETIQTSMTRMTLLFLQPIQTIKRLWMLIDNM